VERESKYSVLFAIFTDRTRPVFVDDRIRCESSRFHWLMEHSGQWRLSKAARSASSSPVRRKGQKYGANGKI